MQESSVGSTRAVLVAFGGLVVLDDEWEPDPSIYFKAIRASKDDQPRLPTASEVCDRIIRKVRSSSGVEAGLLFESSTQKELREWLNPVIVSASLTPSSRKSTEIVDAYQSGSQEIEKFSVVYDGRIVLYAAELDLRRPYNKWSLLDARDLFFEMMKDLHPVIIPPTLAEGVILVSENRTAKWDELNLPLRPDDTVKGILRRVYSQYHYELGTFYETCRIRTKAKDSSNLAERNRRNLLDLLGNYLDVGWAEIYTRYSMLSDMHRRGVALLKNISDFLEYRDSANDSEESLKQLIDRDKRFKKLMEIAHWSHYTHVESLDIEHAMRILEHVRSEAQSYLTSWSTYLAGLGGAVIGTVLTLILTHFLG